MTEPESDSLPSQPDRRTYAFRCTYCRKIVSRFLTHKDLGVPEGENFEVGKLYKYDRCYCGMGKFVSCELTDLDPATARAEMAKRMAH